RADPASVSESWQDFFADYEPAENGEAERVEEPESEPKPKAEEPELKAKAPAKAPAPASRQPEPARVEAPEAPAVEAEAAEPIRGAAARIVANMEASLAVPTATSVRTVPARLLEVNRKVINGYLGRTGQGKVSFTHLIGYA